MYETARQKCRKMHGRSHMSHARKSARVGRVGGQVGEDCRAWLNGEVAGHADFRTRILVSVSLSLSVSVPWNLGLIVVGRHHKRCFLSLVFEIPCRL